MLRSMSGVAPMHASWCVPRSDIVTSTGIEYESPEATLVAYAGVGPAESRAALNQLALHPTSSVPPCVMSPFLELTLTVTWVALSMPAPPGPLFVAVNVTPAVPDPGTTEPTADPDWATAHEPLLPTDA